MSLSAASRVLAQLHLAVTATSRWRAGVEALSITILTTTLILTMGRTRYEAVTALALVPGASDRTNAVHPDVAAKLVLEHAAASANNPPLEDSSTPRTFRVDVLRDHQLTLACQAETSELARELCNGSAAAASSAVPGLRVLKRAPTSTFAAASVLGALWPALLVGFGWFLIRV